MPSLNSYAALAGSRLGHSTPPNPPEVQQSLPTHSKHLAIATIITSLVILVLGWTLVTGIIPTTLPIRIFAATVISGASFGLGIGFHFAMNQM